MAPAEPPRVQLTAAVAGAFPATVRAAGVCTVLVPPTTAPTAASAGASGAAGDEAAAAAAAAAAEVVESETVLVVADAAAGVSALPLRTLSVAWSDRLFLRGERLAGVRDVLCGDRGEVLAFMAQDELVEYQCIRASCTPEGALLPRGALRVWRPELCGTAQAERGRLEPPQ
ncbi:MAG: hypothetical protein ACK4YT_13675, partial [Sphingomonas sp.]